MASATSTSTAELQCDLREPESPAISQPEDDTATSSAQMSPIKNFADEATQTDFPPFGIVEIERNSDKIKFYTGGSFFHVFSLLAAFVPRNVSTKLLLKDEFLLVMMRLG